VGLLLVEMLSNDCAYVLYIGEGGVLFFLSCSLRLALSPIDKERRARVRTRK
jgi:hypothetical protein